MDRPARAAEVPLPIARTSLGVRPKAAEGAAQQLGAERRAQVARDVLVDASERHTLHLFTCLLHRARPGAQASGQHLRGGLYDGGCLSQRDL